MNPILRFIAQWKAYFDTGYNELAAVRVIIFGVAASTLNVQATLLFSFIYFIISLVAGKWLFKCGFMEEKAEVYNIHNRFVKDMRRKRFK